MSIGVSTTHISDLMQKLRKGELDRADVALLEGRSFESLAAEIEEAYPIRFLERSVGAKREIGLARELSPSFYSRDPAVSAFPVVLLVPVLGRCVFLSAYADSISEITLLGRIRLRPMYRSHGEVELRTSRGVKIDKGPDGWTSHLLKSKSIHLKEQLLLARGWRFDRLFSFWLR